MPLNGLQKDVLFTTTTLSLETILGSSIDKSKKIECLKLIISDTKFTIEQAIEVLKKNSHLIRGLSEAINVPNVVRSCWRKLVPCIDNDQPISDALLKELYDYNNYNPLLMAEMCIFETNIDALPELSVVKRELLCLREAYLEMTPLGSYSYGFNGAPFRTFHFRIGRVPFNLDNCGGIPCKAEVQAYIKRIIEDRLEEDTRYQKQLEEKEKIRKEMEEKISLARKETERVKQAANLQEMPLKFSVSDILSSYEHYLSSHKSKSSMKSDRLFQMQHVLLNNKITDMMHQATTELSKKDMELKKSKIFLELRFAECCKILLDVQSKILDEDCCSEDNFNAETINKRYQELLQTTYDIYLTDMVTRWMLDRKRWLSAGNGKPLTEAEFASLSEKFKQEVQNGMKPEFKSFQSFQIKSFNEVSKLKAKLKTRRGEQGIKAVQCKQKWDETSFPLMEFADHCNELRSLSSQLQKSECNLETFNNIISELSKMMSESELKQEGSNLLHYACWGGNLTLIEKLLARRTPVDLLDAEGNSVIHLAVENESSMTVEILETLIKQPVFSKLGNILELKNQRDKTPLHLAAACGNLTAIQWLMAKQNTLNVDALAVEDNSKMTALHYAAREEQKMVVEYLLTLGLGRSLKSTAEQEDPPLTQTVLYDATRGGGLASLRLPQQGAFKGKP